MQEKVYYLSFAELIDRLNVTQMKECYSGTDKYAQEIQDILHDIQIDLDNGVKVTNTNGSKWKYPAAR